MNSEKKELSLIEIRILEIIRDLGVYAYGMTIHKKLEERYQNKAPSLGDVYVTLGRLTDRGLIANTYGDPTDERGSRPRRLVALTAEGHSALQEGE
jgi:DNA-binding PadR family transcriptional regulator